jgi:hypothetical protein
LVTWTTPAVINGCLCVRHMRPTRVVTPGGVSLVHTWATILGVINMCFDVQLVFITR